MATTYKTQQVLRTDRNLQAKSGDAVPEGTRVVAMSMPASEVVKVKVKDPELPELENVRVIAGVRHFNTTRRGRPRKNPEGD